MIILGIKDIVQSDPMKKNRIQKKNFTFSSPPLPLLGVPHILGPEPKFEKPLDKPTEDL